MKLFRTSAFLSLLFLSICLVHCAPNGLSGSGTVTTEERNLTTFNRIDIAGNFELILVPGRTELLKIETDDNLQENVLTKVENSTLRIWHKEPVEKATANTITVSYQSLSKLTMAGAVTARTEGTLKAEKLDIKGSGASDLKVDYQGDELSLDISGAGQTVLTGKARNLDINLSGAGAVEAHTLQSKFGNVVLSGASEVTINAKKALNVTISGAGSVRYAGDPKITKSISGVGSLSPI